MESNGQQVEESRDILCRLGVFFTIKTHQLTCLTCSNVLCRRQLQIFHRLIKFLSLPHVVNILNVFYLPCKQLLNTANIISYSFVKIFHTFFPNSSTVSADILRIGRFVFTIIKC